MKISLFERVEKTVGNGENAVYQHFLLFPQCFPKSSSLGSLKIRIVGCLPAFSPFSKVLFVRIVKNRDSGVKTRLDFNTFTFLFRCTELKINHLWPGWLQFYDLFSVLQRKIILVQLQEGMRSVTVEEIVFWIHRESMSVV